MDVRFASAKAQKAFSIQAELRRTWGAAGATKITLRLQQLAAAPTLVDMRSMPGRCHELKGDRAGQFAVDVHHPFRLIFRPTEPPEQEPAGVDWTKIDNITILEIVDYH